VTYFRWHLVRGCVEWVRITAPRYIAPIVRGMPSVGPCTRAALVIPPLLGLPSSVPYGAPQGGWPEGGPMLAGTGFYLPGELFLPESTQAVPPSFSVPPEALAMLPQVSLTGQTPEVLQAVPPLVETPAQERVIEPASITLALVGAGAAVLVKRRRG
jgi:hypothetical protein